ncbi:hypothetical protein BH11PSE14_BH11PSE14_14810 [soil metagenome]
MTSTLSGCVLVALSVVASTAGAAMSDAAFEAHFLEAQANRGTAEGTAFDGVLAQTFDTLLVRASIDACLRDNPGKQAVHGYFDFVAPQAYQLELRPAGPFAACMERALENRHLPEPPRLPYRNEFRFTHDPDNA